MSKEKKGFTLVEAGIVLVIIGIIITMSVKINNLLNVARVKNELAKIYTISSAVESYYNNHGVLPGDDATNPVGMLAIDNNGIELLTKGGYISDVDFKIFNNKKEQVGTWRFIRCIPMNNAGYRVSGDTTVDSTTTPIFGSLCVYGDNRTDLTTTITTSDYLELSYISYGYELYMDDADLTNGDGRANNTSAANFSTYTRDDMENSKAYTNMNGYFIKIW